MLSEEWIRSMLFNQGLDPNREMNVTMVRAIEREAYKQGQERMRERATSQAAEEAGEHGTDSDGWYICKSLSHQIEELEIEEPK